MARYLSKIWKALTRSEPFLAAPEEGPSAGQLLAEPPVAPEAGEFAKKMMERLRAAKPETKFTISAADPLAIEMKQDDTFGVGVINLHSLFGYCANAEPEDCETASTDFVAKVFAPKSEPIPANLRLIVRTQEYLDYVFGALAEENQPPYRQIGDDLFAIVAIDHPENIALAGSALLRELGLDDGVAWQLAHDQTRAILPTLPDGEELETKMISFFGGDYYASLLADTEAWRVLAEKVGPNLCATVVAAHSVFVGAMPDGQVFDNFKQAVRDDYEMQRRGVSPNVYRFRDGRWVIAN